MLSRKAVHDRMRDTRAQSAPAPEETKGISKDGVAAAAEPLDRENISQAAGRLGAPTGKRAAATKATSAGGPPAKKAKPHNFLLAGAKKARAARSARTAARVGLERSSSSRTDKKLSNTGSGVPISQVVRLKYVKGFTQAVRTPCRLEDLT